jgi:hypothetical protein
MASSITGCSIVSRDWLYKCREMGKRVDEKQYTLAEPVVIELDMDEPETAPVPEPEPEPSSLESVIIVGEREVARPQAHEDTISEKMDVCPSPSPPPPPPPHPQTSSDSSLTPQNTTTETPSLPIAESVGNPASDNTRTSMDPPAFGRHGLKRKSSSSLSGLSEILRNLSKDQLTAAHNKKQPGRSRGPLQGKAAAGTGRVFSRTPSAASSSSGALERPEDDAPPSQKPLPSQALAYNVEETLLEKKLVRAKLDKTAPPLETPRALRNRVQEPTGAVDLTPARRRSTRNKEGKGAAEF